MSLDWLEGDYTQALRLVGQRALWARRPVENCNSPSSVKQANVDWGQLLATPEIQGALLGAGVGGLGGAALGRRKLRSGLLGTLLGAGTGAGLGHLLRTPEAAPASPEDAAPSAAALHKARASRAELGILGADEKTINQAGRAGRPPAQTAQTIAAAVPGAAEQLRSVPAATAVALQQGRPGDALAQLDVAGLKNVLPFSGHFSLPTALAAGGAHLGARKLMESNRVQGLLARRDVRLGRLPRYLETTLGKGEARPALEALIANPSLRGRVAPAGWDVLANIRRSLHAPGAPPKGLLGQLGHYGRQATGGAVPLLAALTPLLYREWLGSGYRSGRQPATDLAAALATLNRGQASQPPVQS